MVDKTQYHTRKCPITLTMKEENLENIIQEAWGLFYENKKNKQERLNITYPSLVGYSK